MARHLRVLIRRLAAQLASFDVVRPEETLANTGNGDKRRRGTRTGRKSPKVLKNYQTRAESARKVCKLILMILNNALFQKNKPHVGSFWHFAICCICVFVYLYFCICGFDICEYNFWYPWIILFSKIYHMLGLSGTLWYGVFVYLCICICVFAHLTP